MDQYTASLQALLQQSTAPDTAQIKAATATLNKDYYKNPQCITALSDIIELSQEQPIRQLAAVELRKRISQRDGALWIKVPVEHREAIKAKSLDRIVVEQVPIVRHSLARVISAIAELEIPLGSWNTLNPWLQNALQSPTPQHREIGSYVLFTSLETFINAKPEELNQIMHVLKTLLSDSSFEVRSTSLRSLGIISQYLERENTQEVKAFQQLVPAMIQVIAAGIEKDDTEAVRHGVDVFETLLILEVPLLNKESIPPLVEFFVTVAGNRNVSDELRVMALSVLTWTIKYKKNKIQSLQLAKPILQHLLPIGAEDEPEDLEDDCPSRLAFRAIDALAGVLPPNVVFPPLMELVESGMQSADPNARKSALTALGVSVEGCSEHMRPLMSGIWPYIDRGFADPSPVVRKAACIAFGCICEWLEEECVARHEVLVDGLLNLLKDPSSDEAACTALDAYLEILGTTIKLYLERVMVQLIHQLDNGSAKVKLLVTGAIGSAAHAAGSDFIPYFKPIVDKLQPCFTTVSEGTEMDLRGVATDALGTFAEAVGKDVFRPWLDGAMQIAFNGLEVGSARLKECSFLLFGVLARVFESEFAVYVDRVAPALISSCNQIENGEDPNLGLPTNASDAFGTGAGDGDEVDIDIDDDDDDDENLKVNSAIAVEKEIAADTMGTVFTAVGEHYLPFLEPSVNQLVSLLDHYYEGIRKSAVTSLLEFVRTFYELSNPATWLPGANVPVPLHQRVEELIESILPSLLLMWESEDDKTVASNLCASLAETMSKVGPGFVHKHFDELVRVASQILEQKALCQQDPDQDGEGDVDFSEEQAEFEGVLISTATDLVAGLASVYGADFAPAFDGLLPVIARYYAPTRTVSDRTSSIGSLGEIITGMKGGISAYTAQIMQLLKPAFSDTEAEVRSNAAFAVGVLVENTDQDVSPYYPDLLQTLGVYFNLTPASTPAEFNARDNAAGAVSRMILKNTGAVPLQAVLPILIASLPLKNDYLENRPVYRAIIHLFNATQGMEQYVDQLLPVFVSVLDPANEDQLGDDVRKELIGLIAQINSVMPDKVAAFGLQAVLQ